MFCPFGCCDVSVEDGNRLYKKVKDTVINI